MTDATIGIVIDPGRAEAGGQRVVRTLDEIRRREEQTQRSMRGLNRGIGDTANSFDTMSGALRRNAQAIAVLQGPLGAISGRFSSLGSLIGAVNPLISGLTISFASLAATMIKAVNNAEQFERSGFKTEAILRATASASGQTAASIREMSQEIAATTLASVRGVEAAAQKLLTFRSVGEEVFRRTLVAAQDLAEVGFGSIDGAATQLGKALENPAQGMTMLTRVGVSFSAQTKEQITLLYEQGRVLEAQQVLLAGVEAQVGGAGAAAAGGLSGAYDTLSQSVEKFLVNVGNSGAIQATTFLMENLAAAVKAVNDAMFPDFQSQLAGAREEFERLKEAMSDPTFDPNSLGGQMSILRLETARQIVEVMEARKQAQEDETDAARERGRVAQDEIANDARLEKSREAATKAMERAAAEQEKLNTLRADTIADLQSELDRQISLTAATERGVDAVNALEDARKAELIVQQLKLDGTEIEVGLIDELVRRIEAQKRATEAVTTAQKDAEIAARDLAREQKRAAEEAQRTYERVIEGISNTTQEKLGDALFDHLRGETLNFGEFLKTTILRAVADLAAAILTQKIVLPIIVQAVGGAPGLFGLTGQAAGIASGQGGFGGFNPLSLLTQGQGGGLFNQFAMSSLGQSLGLSYGAGTLATNAGVFAAGSGALGTFAAGGPAALALTGPGGGMGAISGMATASTGGAVGAATAGGALGASGGLTGLGAGLMAAAPYLAIAAMALPLLMGGLGRKPSVGPTSVGRITDLLDPSSTVLSFDNGGAEGDAVMRVVEAVSNGVREGLDRYTGELRAGSGFDFGFFSAPEDRNRSGQTAGFNVKAIIDGLLEDADRFRGLSEDQAVANATMIALREMVDFQSATLTAIQTTGREDAAGFLEDMEFGRSFDLLRGQIRDLGDSIDASTLAMADLRMALVEQGEEQARAFSAGVNQWLETALRLFSGEQFVSASVGAGTAVEQDIIETLRVSPPQFDEGAWMGSGEDAGHVRFTGGDREGGVQLSPSGVEIGDQFFETRWNHSAGGRGGALELLSPDGDVLGQYSGINEMLGDLGNSLERLAEVTEPASEKAAEYWEQLDRTRDSIDIAKARVDQFFGEITGALEPAIIGQWEARMITATAAIEASRPGLEELNRQIETANDEFEELATTLIDIDAAVSDATAALKDNLREQQEQDLTRRLRQATGLGAANAIDNLIASRAADLTDAAVTGASVSLIDDVFAAELRAALSASTLADLGNILASGAVTDDAARAIMQLMIEEQSLAQVRQQEISGLQTLYAETQRFAAAAGDAARRIRSVAAGFLTDPRLSPLAPLGQLEEARRQFETAFALANDDDPLDEKSQFAIQQMPDLSRTLLEASRAYFGSTENYLSDFNRVQSALGATALRQETIEEQQLSALRDIEASILALGGTVTGGQNPAQMASARGFNFGTNVDVNRSIYNALVAAGLPTPAGFGPTVSGNIGDLRAQNPAVDALVSMMGFATGGSFTVAGPAGNDNLFMPLRLTAGEAVNVHRGDTMAAVVDKLDKIESRLGDVVQLNRAMVFENGQLRIEAQKSRAVNERLSRELADRDAQQPRQAYGT